MSVARFDSPETNKPNPKFKSSPIVWHWRSFLSKGSGRVLAEARLPLSESCTLALLPACVLLAILFLPSLFCPLSVLTVAFAGCCSGRHIVLYSLFDSLRLAIIFVCCSSPPAASTALKPAPPLVFVVVLHRCCIFLWFLFFLFFHFWGDCFSFSSFRQRCRLLDCQTPRACRALSLVRTVSSSVIG